MATSPPWDPSGHPVHRLIQYLDTLTVSVLRFQQITFFAPFYRGPSDRDDYAPDKRRAALEELHREYHAVSDCLFPPDNGSPQYATAALADAAVAYFCLRGQPDAEQWVREAAAWVDHAGRWTPATAEPSGREWPKQSDQFKQEQQAVFHTRVIRANLFAALARCGDVTPPEIYGRVGNAPLPPLPAGILTITVEELTRWADAARPGGTPSVTRSDPSPTEKEEREVAPTAVPTSPIPQNDRQFLIRDLLEWAGIRELGERAIQPGFNYQTVGVYITSGTVFPNPCAELPNGFRFPPGALRPTPCRGGYTDIIPWGVFSEIISRYRGPDPTRCSAFAQLEAKAMCDGGEIDVARVIRWVGELCQRRGINRTQAESLPVDDLLPPTAPAVSPLAMPVEDVHLDPATFARGKADLASVRQLAFTNTVLHEMYVTPLDVPTVVPSPTNLNPSGERRGEGGPPTESLKVKLTQPMTNTATGGVPRAEAVKRIQDHWASLTQMQKDKATNASIVKATGVSAGQVSEIMNDLGFETSAMKAKKASRTSKPRTVPGGHDLLAVLPGVGADGFTQEQYDTLREALDKHGPERVKDMLQLWNTQDSGVDV